MIKLRDYQQKFKTEVTAALRAVRAVVGVLPTGAGKTVIFSSMISDHVGASIAVVHRKEIVSQISCSLAMFDIPHRIIAPPATIAMIRRKHLDKFGRSFVDPNAQCGVASVQSLTSKSSAKNHKLQKWLDQISFAVYDEGHHYVDEGQWAAAVHRLETAMQLFITATPERADGIGLGVEGGGFAHAMVEGPTVAWLIEQGYLSKFKYKAPATDLDVRDVALGKNGDFNANALRARVLDSHIVGDIVKHYQQFGENRKAIVFSTDVKTAHDQAEAFNKVGIKSVALSGATEAPERERAISDFETGDIQVLINVDLFDEGFDVPAVEVVILGRPTMSLGKYLQMVGRALRILDGKPYAIVIDPVRNWERHGMPNWPRKWTLDARNKRERDSAADDLVPQRICDMCTQPYEVFYKACPYCGHVPVPAKRATPENVDGDLVELDVEALAALFAKKDEANMTEEEYARSQISRDIPPIGRSQDAKRYEAAKYRRGTLVNLMGWWMGAQPAERSLAEKQKRFFVRFGVDVLTAQSLNAKDTDALIDAISKKFHLDLTA